jgi:agmatinase
MLPGVVRRGTYINSLERIESADTVIVGVPMDHTCSFRAGTRFGPSAIRNVSDVLETYSPELSRDLSDVAFFDAGDLELPFGDVRESIRRIRETVSRILKMRKTPGILGGEHLVTLPIIEAILEYESDLHVVHFDAHADLREDYCGERLSHATVMRHIAERIGGENIFQFGIRSGTREEFVFAMQNTHMFCGNLVESMNSVIGSMCHKPIYITLDIDVLDPAYAPGTGTPEPGGASSRELLEAIRLFEGANIVGFDIVEVSPQYDSSERTQIVAAKLLRELLLLS